MKLQVCLLMFLIFIIGCGNSEVKNVAVTEEINNGVNVSDYFNNGVKDLKDHDIKKAVDAFHLAIKQNPKDFRSYIMLGKLYMEMKLYDNAIKYFTLASRLNPGDGHIFQTIAKCYGLAGNNQEAINNVKKSVVIFKAQKDEENYKASLVMLKMLMNSTENVTK